MEDDFDEHSKKFKELESYFVLKEIKKQEDVTSGYVFECVKCHPKIQTIASCAQAPYSNLRKHFKCKHKTLLPELEDAITNEKKSRQPLNASTSKISTPKPKVSNPFEAAKQAAGTLSQKEFTNAVVDLITSENLAFTITRRPGWRRFLSKVQPKREIPCYETISNTIDAQFDSMISNMKKQMSDAQYIACSTDGWSAAKKSYLGYTSTWFDENFKRIIAVLACRRFIGRETFDTLAPHMCGILEEYSIQKKTLAFTTDGASNYHKASVNFVMI